MDQNAIWLSIYHSNNFEADNKHFNPTKRTNKFFAPSANHCRQTASISDMNLQKILSDYSASYQCYMKGKIRKEGQRKEMHK